MLRVCSCMRQCVDHVRCNRTCAKHLIADCRCWSTNNHNVDCTIYCARLVRNIFWNSITPLGILYEFSNIITAPWRPTTNYPGPPRDARVCCGRCRPNSQSYGKKSRNPGLRKTNVAHLQPLRPEVHHRRLQTSRDQRTSREALIKLETQIGDRARSQG